MTNGNEIRPGRLPGMERMVAVVLLGGVSLSVLSIGAGLLWQLGSASHPGLDQALPHTHFAKFAVDQLGDVVRYGLTPGRLVNLGIILLLLTPYLRVIFSMAYFALVERNLKYGLITGFVGAVLTYSLFLSS